MVKPSKIPPGCWPALMRDEFAAGYVGEASAETFLARVGIVWPRPWMDIGTGRGRYRVWRKVDLDRIIDPDGLKGLPEAW